MNERWKTFAWAAALFYMVLLSFNWSALTRRADLQTKSMLDYAMLDYDATVMAAIDSMLMHAADSIVAEFGAPSPQPAERMALVAGQRELDEINVVAPDGRILASTDPKLVGVTMVDRKKSAEFMVLTNGTRHAFSQPFRQGAHNPEVRRKYVGVAFPNGNGFIQVGIDEAHVTKIFPSMMDFIFDGWLLGRTGFFLCADVNDGRLISNPARHRDEAQFLSETGYDPDDPVVREDGKTTFRQKIFGEVCDCRAAIYCGHRIIACLPPAEYYNARTFYANVMAFILAMVFIVFVLLFRRIDRDADRLKAFYAAEEAARAKDMEIAKTIQTSALPNALPVNPHFQLYAAMQTAKEVGGDFYDHFPLDDTHYAFLVADVSGKGITAALYMMTAKTLIKDTLLALRDPAEALTKVNAELCRNNPANMFVTAWVGVLDIETGTVAFANAGHNPPVKIQGAKSKVQSPKSKVQNGKAVPEDHGADKGLKAVALADNSDFIASRSGPMLAFMDGIAYSQREVSLAPGDSLFLYTDGVTEALDPKNELYGEDRLLVTLRAIESPEPESVCTIVRAAVTAFAAGAPQADDITVLAIKFVSRPRVFSRSFAATKEGLSQASAFLDELLSPYSSLVDDAEKYQLLLPSLQIFLDEIGSNIVRYSGASGFVIDVELTDTPDGIRLVFFDDGMPYDPLSHVDPDTTLSADKRQIGGLGIFMVKKMATSVAYARTNNRNRLTVFKKL